MYIAVTARGDSPDAVLDDRFGRAPFFAIVATDSGSVEFAPNPNVDAGSGAGIGSAEYLSRRRVEAVVTGQVGPKASRALSAAGIAVYIGRNGTVQENIAAFGAGQLERIDGPTTRSHRGLGRTHRGGTPYGGGKSR